MKKVYIIFGFYLLIFSIGIFISINTINKSIKYNSSVENQSDFYKTTDLVILL